MLKNTIVILLAIAATFAISYTETWFTALWNPPPGMKYLGPENWPHAIGDTVLHLSRDLLPGFIVGALLSSRQIIAGAFTAALATTSMIFLDNPLYFSEPYSLTVAIYAGVYGAAGAALGFNALGRSKSFKASRTARMT